MPQVPSPNNNNKKQNNWKTLAQNIILIFLVLFVVSSIAASFSAKQESQVSLNQLAQQINSGNVKSIVVSSNDVKVTYKDGTKAVAEVETNSSLSQTLDNLGVSKNQMQQVNFSYTHESGFWYWVGLLLPYILSFALFGLFLWWMTRQAQSGQMQALSFGKASVKMYSGGKDRITFKDVAGCKEAKDDLQEIVEFLKYPQKFLDMGARIPRGVLLVGAPGTGKCITGDSLALTNKGLIPIEDIPKYFTVTKTNEVVGASVISFDEKDQNLKSQLPSHWFDLGRAKTLKIKTNIGTAIEGTYEHPLIALGEDGNLIFKKISDITVGDYLAVAYGCRAFGNYNKIPNEDMAYLLGILTGDGCLTVKDVVVFSNTDSEVVEKVRNIVKSAWNYDISKSNSRPYNYYIRKSSIKDDLISYGLAEVNSKYKKVPETVLLASESINTAFLRGLFDADGSCGKEEVELSSSSVHLAQTAHQMLLNLGIVSRLHERKKRYNNQLQWHIAISGDFLPVFQEKINFSVKRKNEALKRLISKKRNANNNVVYYQGERMNRLWMAIKENGFKTDRNFYKQGFYKNLHRHINCGRNPSFNSLSATMTSLCEKLPDIMHHEDYKFLEKLSNNYFFTQVTEINKSKNKVYDFTVPDSHSFVANGLINHNTLLARAVAGEANVPFFHISGSEFVEMFVGVGASRVRDLFRIAKKMAPTIVFIDEIDAVGRQRGTGLGGGHDEREQTLNQILVEMDGFDRDTNVIVIAATNRPDILDSALLRPGRFDRRVLLDEPDLNDREAILQIHAKGKKLSGNVNLREIAERTPGFSGADLANLINEAAIGAAGLDKKTIEQIDLVNSIEKVLLGPERKSHILSASEKRITAYHEAGHALTAAALPDTDEIHKVSIISRGRAGGYTLKLPSEDKHLKTKSELLSDIAVSLGGYAAEKEMFGDITTGSSNDLQNATSIARELVMRFGMSNALGPISLSDQQEMVFLGRELASGPKYSEDTARKIDEEVMKTINMVLARVKHIVISRKEYLVKIAEDLIQKEVIERKEFAGLVMGLSKESAWEV